MKKTLLAALGAAALALALFACGGGGGSGSMMSAGAPATPNAAALASRVDGTVTGFASVVIDGYEYGDSTSTTVSEEINPGALSALGLGLLQMGEHVDFAMQGGVLGAGIVRPRVVGPVASVSGTQFVALGQTVETSATTIYGGGYTGPANMNPGDIVKVHGWANPDGSIAATRVELVADPSQLPGYLVVGDLETLGGSALNQTFAINGLAVTDTTSTMILPAMATLANGDELTVFAPLSAYAGTSTPTPTVTAGVVRVHQPFVGAIIVQGGLVRAVATANGTVTGFTIDDFTVDTTSSSLTIMDDGAPGSLSDITVGADVIVLGTVSSSGTLVASKIWIWTPRALLAGPIFAVASGNSAAGGSFTLRHTNVNYTASTVFKPAGATWSELTPGKFVFVTGTMGTNGLTADMIAYTPVPCGIAANDLWGDAPSGWAPPSIDPTRCPLGTAAGPSVVFHYFGTANAVTSSGSSGSFTLTEANGTSITVEERATTVYAPAGQSIANVIDGSQVLVLGTLDSSGDVTATFVAILQ